MDVLYLVLAVGATQAEKDQLFLLEQLGMGFILILIFITLAVIVELTSPKRKGRNHGL